MHQEFTVNKYMVSKKVKYFITNQIVFFREKISINFNMLWKQSIIHQVVSMRIISINYN